MNRETHRLCNIVPNTGHRNDHSLHSPHSLYSPQPYWPHQPENVKELSLPEKYESCKQLNIELCTKLEKYRTALRKSELDSERKAKAIAVYIKNTCDIKQNLNKEKMYLKSQVILLENTLKEKQEEINKLMANLQFEKREFSDLCLKSFEEKTQLKNEYQGLIDSFKHENNKLNENNKKLLERIISIKEFGETLKGQTIEELKSAFKKQTLLRKELIKSNEVNEQHMKLRFNSLTNKYIYIRKQNDINKREAVANKYGRIASRSVYANAIKKLSKFSVDNNEEVFTAIIQIMEKMRFNAQKRIMDKTAKTVIDIKKQSTAINNKAQKMVQKRNDNKINCAFCEIGFCSAAYLTHHMISEHDFSLEETDDVEMEDMDNNNPTQNEIKINDSE